jgi:hypothetical protein
VVVKLRSIPGSYSEPARRTISHRGRRRDVLALFRLGRVEDREVLETADEVRSDPIGFAGELESLAAGEELFELDSEDQPREVDAEAFRACTARPSSYRDTSQKGSPPGRSCHHTGASAHWILHAA